MLSLGFSSGVSGGVTQELANRHAQDTSAESLQHVAAGELVIITGHFFSALAVKRRAECLRQKSKFVTIEQSPAQVGHTFGHTFGHIFGIAMDDGVGGGFLFRAR